MTKNDKNNSVEVVKKYLQSVMDSDITAIHENTKDFVSDSAVFECGHPIKTLQGNGGVAEKLWKPLKQAFHNLKSIPHIALDGTCEIDGKEWVSITGMYSGNFLSDLYTIPATKNYAYLRFGHFFYVENGKIVKAYVLFDYIQLMQYAGVNILPKMIGGNGDVMPPVTADGGVWNVDANAEQSQKSMEVVMSMLAELLVTSDTTASNQRSYWHKNMTWYGPSGIGTYHTLEGFEKYRNAFLNTFLDRDYGNHVGVIAKNNYVCVVGWKGVHATHEGSGWLGLAPTGKKIVMPLMDFWRVKDGLIEENWVLIDIVSILHQLGIDVFRNIDCLYNKTLFPLPEHVENSAITDKAEAVFKKYLAKYIS